MTKKPTNIFKQRTAEMLVLLLLKESDCHGYELRRRLQEQSNDLLTVQEGSFYPILRGLASEGAISAKDTFLKAKNGGTRIRIMYHIEHGGLERLQELKEEYQAFCSGVEHVLQADLDS